MWFEKIETKERFEALNAELIKRLENDSSYVLVEEKKDPKKTTAKKKVGEEQ